MSKSPPRGTRRQVLLWAARLAAALALIAVALPALGVLALRVQDPEPKIIARHGQLTAVEVLTERFDRGHVVRDVALTSSSGLTVALKVKSKAPPTPDAQPVRRPLVLVLAGFDTGRDAVELIDDTRGMVLAAVAYPVDKRRVREAGVFAAAPLIRRAVIDSMAAPLLALDYLRTLSEVDPARVELVGVSLGGPFACVAGALDDRFTRVWSIHSGGRIELLLDLAMRHNDLPGPAAFALSRLVAWSWRSVAPEQYVGRIAPRPFVLVNGRDDTMVPAASIQSLFASAREPKSQVWLTGGHVGTSRRDILDQIVALVEHHLQAGYDAGVR